MTLEEYQVLISKLATAFMTERSMNVRALDEAIEKAEFLWRRVKERVESPIE